jgi:hypothetical protein
MLHSRRDDRSRSALQQVMEPEGSLGFTMLTGHSPVS